MTVRFNPPPGWQVPAGFRPEPGWEPDPAWPPAPPGWEYWTEEGEATSVLAPSAVAAGANGGTTPDLERTTLLAPISAPAPVPAPVPVPAAAGHDPLREPMPLVTVAPPPPPPATSSATASGAARTRSVAREGKAVPLPPGPLGHLRGLDTGTLAAVAPLSTATPPSDGAGERRRKGFGPYLIPGVAIACFAFGVIVGVVMSVGQASDARQLAADARHAQEQVLEDREDLEIQQKTLKEAQDALKEHEAKVKQRETAVAQAEADVTTKQQEVAQQQADAASQQQQAAAAAAANQAGPQGPQGFQTCDQLRQAGVATPIHKGDPSYSRLLDLDGNDWACE